jgi:hypothetical protein
MKRGDKDIFEGQQPGMRLKFFERGDELWCSEEHYLTATALLWDEYYKVAHPCIKAGLPEPPIPHDENGAPIYPDPRRQEPVIAKRERTGFVRMLTPAEIALRTRNQPTDI